MSLTSGDSLTSVQAGPSQQIVNLTNRSSVRAISRGREFSVFDGVTNLGLWVIGLCVKLVLNLLSGFQEGVESFVLSDDDSLSGDEGFQEVNSEPTLITPIDLRKYKISEILGEGTYSLVFLAEETSLGELFSLKITRFEDNAGKELKGISYDKQHDISTLAKRIPDHPFVMKTHESFLCFQEK